MPWNGWPISVGIGGPFPSESVAHFRRKGWPTSVGIGGPLPSEGVAHIDWNRWPASPGRSGPHPAEYALSAVTRTLRNPRYAGAYAYGRRRYAQTPDGKKKYRDRECHDWLACIPNAHPGYITWEQYQENLRILKTNAQGYEPTRGSPPREGPSLLQGRAICGRCGRHLRVRYLSRRGRLDSWYICDRANGSQGEPNCQSIAGRLIDEAVGDLVAESMTPAAVELALEIRREIRDRQQEADALRYRAVERAQVEADLAQRRFMMVDPANRLVADTLEAEWNEKLRLLAAAREEWDRRRCEEGLPDDATCERLLAMTADFKRLWKDPATPHREKKRMLAHIIEDVTLIKLPGEGVTRIHVRFKGGKTETLTTPTPKSATEQIRTPPEIVELVDQLLENHIYSEIANILNERGLRPGGAARPGREDARFTAKRITYLVRAYRLRSRYDRLRDQGMLTRKEMTERLGIHEATLYAWVKHGIIKAHTHNGHAYLFEDPGPDPPVKQNSRWNLLVGRAAAMEARRPKDMNTGSEEV